MAVPTIASGALRKILACCGELKIDGSAVLAAAGIDRVLVDDRDARVPIARLHAAWEALAARTPRSDSALLATTHYEAGDYGLVGFVIMTCATVDEAMGHFVRYIGLWTDEPVFVRERNVVRAAYRNSFPDTLGKRMSTESAFSQIIYGARALTGKGLSARRVRFVHGPPVDRTGFDKFFGCEVEFSTTCNELEFRPEDLALAFPRGDAKLGAFIRETANQALNQRDVTADSPLERARMIVADELSRSLPSFETVAHRMATSPRTLRRRLAEAGTSFRELLDETRAALARAYVRDKRIPLSEVAFLLGFAEPSTFHRAFKRWTKTTPAAWRAGA